VVEIKKVALLIRPLRQYPAQSPVQVRFRLVVTMKVVALLPPTLQVSPSNPVSANWAIVDQYVIALINNLYIIVNRISNADIRFDFRCKYDIFRPSIFL